MDSETFNMMPEVTFGATSNTTANEKAKVEKISEENNLYKITIASSNDASILDKINVTINNEKIINNMEIDENNNVLYYDITQLSDGTKISK